MCVLHQLDAILFLSASESSYRKMRRVEFVGSGVFEVDLRKGSLCLS